MGRWIQLSPGPWWGPYHLELWRTEFALFLVVLELHSVAELGLTEEADEDLNKGAVP